MRSSDSHFVKASGLRWMSLMLLAPIPWAERIWALPFLTALVPSERGCRENTRDSVDDVSWGPVWKPITPKTGALFHA